MGRTIGELRCASETGMDTALHKPCFKKVSSRRERAADTATGMHLKSPDLLLHAFFQGIGKVNRSSDARSHGNSSANRFESDQRLCIEGFLRWEEGSTENPKQNNHYSVLITTIMMAAVALLVVVVVVVVDLEVLLRDANSGQVLRPVWGSRGFGCTFLLAKTGSTVSNIIALVSGISLHLWRPCPI